MRFSLFWDIGPIEHCNIMKKEVSLIFCRDCSICFSSLRAYGHLCGVPDLIPMLQSSASSYDISPLLRYLLPLLIHSVVTQSGQLITLFIAFISPFLYWKRCYVMLCYVH